MDIKKLKKLLGNEENVKQDFKLKLDFSTESSKKEFAKDICALANSRGGRGYLIIGVEDKTKRIVGIEQSDFSEEQIQQVISSRIDPPVPVSFEIISYESKKIGVITIYQSDQKPYQFRENGSFYIRRGSTTDTMRKGEIISAMQDNLSLDAELCPMIKSGLNDLDMQLVKKYFKKHNVEINEDNKEILMSSAGIITRESSEKEFRCTMGGLLVFSRINFWYLPNNMIRLVNKVNNNFNEIYFIQGDLLSILNQCEEKLNAILPKKYPINAVFEGIKNAVIYRDYTTYNKEIEVVIDYKNITVVSPGILLKNSKAPLTNSHNYIKRNMWIYEKLITLETSNKFNKSGRGFTRMRKAFSNHGKVKFLNVISENQFKIIYPSINYFK
ncbi:putative DNA binding domain-containing protein [Clostridium sediminicola]|uniref:AlbA family DNA-binding domain-containing protein n=1 Tax=Clostridium sediminicola TaxID=3114879 RepID=UPI0031F1E8D8